MFGPVVLQNSMACDVLFFFFFNEKLAYRVKPGLD